MVRCAFDLNSAVALNTTVTLLDLFHNTKHKNSLTSADSRCPCAIFMCVIICELLFQDPDKVKEALISSQVDLLRVKLP